MSASMAWLQPPANPKPVFQAQPQMCFWQFPVSWFTSTIVVVDCAPCHQPELRTLLTTNGLLSFFDLKGQSEDEEWQVLSIVVTSRQLRSSSDQFRRLQM
jgi:hypothetical protein